METRLNEALYNEVLGITNDTLRVGWCKVFIGQVITLIPLVELSFIQHSRVDCRTEV